MNPLKQPLTFSKILIASFSVVVLVVSSSMIGLYKLRQDTRVASCANDVFFLNKAIREYANAHNGFFPDLDDVRGNLMIEPEGFYPNYLDNSCWVQCEFGPLRLAPGKEDEVNLGVEGFSDASFVYIPWVIHSEEEMLAFIETYKTMDLKQQNTDLEINLERQNNYLARICRPKQGMSMYWSTDKTLDSMNPNMRPSPFLIEWPSQGHAQSNVFYTDGTSRRMKLGDGFPMTENILQGLREISQLDERTSPKP